MIEGKKLKLSRKGVAKAKLSCPAAEASGPCEGRLTLKTVKKIRAKGKKRKLTLAKAKFSVAAGKTKAVKLKLNKRDLKLVTEMPKARKVEASARVSDQAGNEASSKKKLKLVPKKAKGKR